jgi:hypothetical protein
MRVMSIKIIKSSTVAKFYFTNVSSLLFQRSAWQHGTFKEPPSMQQ